MNQIHAIFLFKKYNLKHKTTKINKKHSILRHSIQLTQLIK